MSGTLCLDSGAMKDKATAALNRLIELAQSTKEKINSCDMELIEIFKGIEESSEKQSSMLEDLGAIIDNREILWPK